MTKQKTKKTATTKKTLEKAKPARKASKAPRNNTADEAAADEAAAADTTAADTTAGTATIYAAPDERLPPPGTVIEKRDRHGNVRCKCTMMEGGKVHYNRRTYASISAAAMAAATDLGLENKTQNGYTFWGLSKPPRPAAAHSEAADRAWERCAGHFKAELGKELSADERNAVTSRLRGIGHQIETFLEQVA